MPKRLVSGSLIIPVSLLQEEELKKSMLMVFANKQVIGDTPAAELGLDSRMV